jgi:hypothetical protein
MRRIIAGIVSLACMLIIAFIWSIKRDLFIEHE